MFVLIEDAPPDLLMMPTLTNSLQSFTSHLTAPNAVSPVAGEGLDGVEPQFDKGAKNIACHAPILL
jgi:hypothetical protein